MTGMFKKEQLLTISLCFLGQYVNILWHIPHGAVIRVFTMSFGLFGTSTVVLLVCLIIVIESCPLHSPNFPSYVTKIIPLPTELIMTITPAATVCLQCHAFQVTRFLPFFHPNFRNHQMWFILNCFHIETLLCILT